MLHLSNQNLLIILNFDSLLFVIWDNFSWWNWYFTKWLLKYFPYEVLFSFNSTWLRYNRFQYFIEFYFVESMPMFDLKWESLQIEMVKFHWRRIQWMFIEHFPVLIKFSDLFMIVGMKKDINFTVGDKISKDFLNENLIFRAKKLWRWFLMLIVFLMWILKYRVVSQKDILVEYQKLAHKLKIIDN